MTKNVANIAAGLLPKEQRRAVNNLDISSLTQGGTLEKTSDGLNNPLDNDEDFINENGEFSAKLRLYDDEDGMAALAYYGLAGEVVRAIDPHTEGDLVATLINFLTFYGNIIGDSAHFMAGTKKHPARLFSVVVGATGKGRKGTS